ncbi:MAG: HU family DNA-binding protein [Candidatus Firestonebacteria bacterium]|nr:HU family DNA-binding protein [Candidatus Firestonebacteria bacterium]
MTKVELIDKVAEGLGLPKREIEKMLDKLISTIQNALKEGKKVSVAGLGTFIVKEKKARLARNPKTGESVQVAAKRAPKFRPGKELKEIIQ